MSRAPRTKFTVEIECIDHDTREVCLNVLNQVPSNPTEALQMLLQHYLYDDDAGPMLCGHFDIVGGKNT